MKRIFWNQAFFVVTLHRKINFKPKNNNNYGNKEHEHETRTKEGQQ